MTLEKRLVTVYKSSRKDEMYLYTDRKSGLEEVPEALMGQFGKALEVMTLVLTPEKKLARAQARDVLNAIAEKGFFLQMPPQPEAEQLAVIRSREMNPAVGRHRSGEED